MIKYKGLSHNIVTTNIEDSYKNTITIKKCSEPNTKLIAVLTSLEIQIQPHFENEKICSLQT